MGRGSLHLKELRRLRPDSFATRVLRARPILIAMLVGGATLATSLAILFLPHQPTDDLLPPPPLLTNGITIKATIRSVDPPRGEMTVRVVPTANGADYSKDGRLVTPVTLIFNDVAGRSILNFPEGSFMAASDITLAMVGGRVVRYPFDNYQAYLRLLSATIGPPEALRPAAVVLSLSSSLDEVHLSAEGSGEGVSSTLIKVERPMATRAWVIFLMILMWALGLAAASIAWVVIVWNEAFPFWSWGFLAGVLFALPSLRANLPGAPPNGSLIDIAAFYWSIGLVAGTLIVMVITWNIRVREQARAAAGTAGSTTMQQWAVKPLDRFDEPR